jgi:hypothetical protein
MEMGFPDRDISRAPAFFRINTLQCRPWARVRAPSQRRHVAAFCHDELQDTHDLDFHRQLGAALGCTCHATGRKKFSITRYAYMRSHAGNRPTPVLHRDIPEKPFVYSFPVSTSPRQTTAKKFLQRGSAYYSLRTHKVVIKVEN